MSEEITKSEELTEQVETVVEETEEAVAEVVSETVEEAKEVADKKAEPEISKSKAKREARKAEAKKQKRKQTIGAVIEWAVGIGIAAIFIGAIIGGIYQQATKLKSSNDFSAYITEEGFYEGEDLSAVKDLGLDNLVIPASEVNPSDEDVQTEIDSMVSSYEYMSDDTTLAAKSGDKLNIDYVGTIDDVEFDGGSATAYDLTLGSGSFIDDFEAQLEGSHPGDAVTVEVTFPDDYSSEDLQGKDAVFAVTVNGIYVLPEFNDEFVATYYSDKGSTTEELRQSVFDEKLSSNVKTYVSDYISENASVSKYPKGLLKHVGSLLYYNDLQSYEYVNSYYSYYLGSALYSEFSDYIGMSDSEYQADIKERAKKSVATMMTYESVFAKNNLTVTDEKYQTVLYAAGDGAEDTYGAPYLHQLAVEETALDFIIENATIQ